MKVYIYNPVEPFNVCLVVAEPINNGVEFRVHHPYKGYSVWPGNQFEKAHRTLTAKERQLINMSTAELEVMGISDNALALV